MPPRPLPYLPHHRGLAVGTLHSIVRQAGLTVAESMALPD